MDKHHSRHYQGVCRGQELRKYVWNSDYHGPTDTKPKAFQNGVTVAHRLILHLSLVKQSLGGVVLSVFVNYS